MDAGEWTHSGFPPPRLLVIFFSKCCVSCEIERTTNEGKKTKSGQGEVASSVLLPVFFKLAARTGKNRGGSDEPSLQLLFILIKFCHINNKECVFKIHCQRVW